MNTKSIVFALVFLCNSPDSLSLPRHFADLNVLPVSSFSVFRNPAITALEKRPSVCLSLSSLYALQTVRHAQFCVIWPEKRSGIEASFESLGNGIAETRSTGIGISRILSNSLSFGCKVVYEEFSVQAYGKTGGFTMNTGMQANLSKRLATAFSASGLFKNRDRIYNSGFSEPAFRWGFLYEAEQKMRVMAEIEKVQDKRSELKFGLMYSHDSAFAFSASINKQFKEPGFGIHYQKKQFSTALSCRIHVLLGISYQIVLSYALKN